MQTQGSLTRHQLETSRCLRCLPHMLSFRRSDLMNAWTWPLRNFPWTYVEVCRERDRVWPVEDGDDTESLDNRSFVDWALIVWTTVKNVCLLFWVDNDSDISTPLQGCSRFWDLLDHLSRELLDDIQPGKLLLSQPWRLLGVISACSSLLILTLGCCSSYSLRELILAVSVLDRHKIIRSCCCWCSLPLCPCCPHELSNSSSICGVPLGNGYRRDRIGNASRWIRYGSIK